MESSFLLVFGRVKSFFGLNIVFINASFYSASSLAGIVVIIRNRTSKIQVRIQHLTPYWITSLLRNSVQARGLSFSFDFFSLMKDTLQYQQGFEPITFKSRASVPTTHVHIKLFLKALGEKLTYKIAQIFHDFWVILEDFTFRPNSGGYLRATLYFNIWSH